MELRKKSILIALCLGDGYITHQRQLRKGKYYQYNYLEVSHGSSQKNYIEWKANLCTSVTGRKSAVRPKKYKAKEILGVPVEESIGYTFTNTSPYFRILRRWLYPNNKKYLNRKYLEYLDPLGIAIWFMDDGSILRRKYKGKYCGFYLRISTYCSYEEANTIIKYFNKVWDIYPTKICEHTKKDTYTINFGAKEGKKLINIIKPFMCPSMMYKVLYNIEDLYTYYNIHDASEILALCTLESDRLEMEAHTTSIKK